MLRRDLAATIVALSLLLATSTHASDLRLGAGDRIRVEVFGRADLNTDQDILPSGVVQLPLIGERHAAGLTLDELQVAVTDALANRVETNPSVLVTVVRWRPVYILGDVRSPQAIDYTPDLTVLKAVARVGGYGASGEVSTVESIRSREKLNTAFARRDRLQAREARLLAEREQLVDVTFPWGDGAEPRTVDVAELIDTERRLFASRRESAEARTRSLGRLAETYKAEIGALTAQKSALEEELRIVSADVELSTELTAKGLELRSRNSALQRSRLDVVARLAENGSFLSRATANLQETLQQLEIDPAEREQAILAELADVRQGLREVDQTILAESRVLGDSRRPGTSTETGGIPPRDMTIEIVRGRFRVQAGEMEPLFPGDVVEVFLLDAIRPAGEIVGEIVRGAEFAQ
jgi:protein involved in polysaccharide export with SLBB domain